LYTFLFKLVLFVLLYFSSISNLEPNPLFEVYSVGIHLLPVKDESIVLVRVFDVESPPWNRRYAVLLVRNEISNANLLKRMPTLSVGMLIFKHEIEE